jgi:hypothetical protein
VRRLLPSVLLTLALAPGCGSNATKVLCTIEAKLEADVAGRPYVDCTAAAVPPDGGFVADAMARAQQCVLDAIKQNQAFVLAYDVPHPINHLRVGLSGIPGGTVASAREYVYSGDVAGKAGDGNPTISVKSCTAILPDLALVATAGCTPAAGKPCLTCTRPGAGTISCGGQ